MRFLTALSLISFALTMYVGIYVFKYDRKTRLNLVFLLMCAAAGIWTFCYSFVYSAVTPEIAVFWARLAAIGWLPLPLIVLYFYMALIGNTRVFKSALMLVSLITPLPFFAYEYYTAVFNPSAFVATPLGYAETIDLTNKWTVAFYLYALLLILSGLLAGISHALRSGDATLKKQLGIILSGAFVAFFVALCFNFLMPVLGYKSYPDITPITLVFPLGSLWYVIARYKFMVVTVESIADEIIEVMSDALLFISPGGTVSLSNRAAEKLLKYSREELHKKTINSLCAEKNIFDIYYLKRAIESEKVMEEVVVFVTKTGVRVPMSCSFSVLRDRYSNVTGIVLLLRDIRDRLELEKSEAKKQHELEKAYSDLERTQLASLNVMEDLERKSAELQLAVEELQNTQTKLLQTEKMAAVGKLAGGVAHEINNPMTVILGYAQSLARKLKKEDQFYEPIKAIENESLRVKKLVADLLTFSRTAKTSFERIDLKKVIESSLSLVHTQAKIKEIEVEVSIAEGLDHIDANPNQIQQVLINLCNNAVDALGKGGRIKAEAFLDGAFAVIKVSDNGTGIPKEYMEKIFEPFFTTKDVGKGTGLGLSLCYEIIKKHGGDIGVESEEGKGTVFSVRLPVNQKP